MIIFFITLSKNAGLNDKFNLTSNTINFFEIFDFWSLIWIICNSVYIIYGSIIP